MYTDLVAFEDRVHNQIKQHLEDKGSPSQDQEQWFRGNYLVRVTMAALKVMIDVTNHYYAENYPTPAPENPYGIIMLGNESDVRKIMDEMTRVVNDEVEARLEKIDQYLLQRSGFSNVYSYH